MTAQIFLNIIHQNYLPLKKVNLLIFDECHKGVKDHPMRLIMKQFEFYKEEDHPKVLGVSATLLNRSIGISKLCDTLKVLLITLLINK